MAVVTYTFGLLLVIGMVAAIFYYFSPKRKDSVEQPKYDILEEDEKK